jgi:hypothetical protein
MAVIVSHPYSIIRGSIAGTTYLGNQFHPIVGRQRVSPVNPRTADQTLIRGAMGACAIIWKSILTVAQRLAWDNYALTCIYTKATGQYTIPGRSIFIAGRGLIEFLNNRFAVAVPVVNTAPTEPGFYTVNNISATPGIAGQIDVTVNNFGTHDVQVLIQVSPPQNVSRNRYQGPWVQTWAVCDDAPSGASTVIPVTGLPSGLKFFLRVRAVVNDGPHAISIDYITNSLSG